jgi:Nucleoside H+ symporter
LAAMRLLKGWPFATYCLCTLGVCITMPFTTQASPLLLEHLGIVQPWLSPTLTISQVSEVISLFMLPMFLIRLGLRGSMVFGLICWLAALCILAVGEPAWLVISSLPLNGLCVTGFLVTGQVYVNSEARGDLKASVQSLLTFVQGIGLFSGHILVGILRSMAKNPADMGDELHLAFQVAAVINAFLLVVFLLCFWPTHARKHASS